MISQRVQFGWVARRLGLRPALFGSAEGRIQGMPASLRGLGTLELVLGGLPEGVAFRSRGAMFRPPGSAMEIGDPEFDQCFLVAGEERQAAAVIRAALGADKAGALSLARYEGGGLSLAGEQGRLSLAGDRVVGVLDERSDSDGSEV